MNNSYLNGAFKNKTPKFNIFCLFFPLSELPESLKPIVKLMLAPDVNRRPEVKDLMQMSVVKAHIERRHRKLRMASLLQKISALTRLWHSLLAFITSLIFFKRSKKAGDNNDDDTMEVDQSRVTPEPFTNDRDIPDIVLNSHTFSDDGKKKEIQPTQCQLRYVAYFVWIFRLIIK